MDYRGLKLKATLLLMAASSGLKCRGIPLKAGKSLGFEILL